MLQLVVRYSTGILDANECGMGHPLYVAACMNMKEEEKEEEEEEDEELVGLGEDIQATRPN